MRGTADWAGARTVGRKGGNSGRNLSSGAPAFRAKSVGDREWSCRRELVQQREIQLYHHGGWPHSPLVLDGGSPQLSIMSDRIEGGSLLLPPDTDADVVIELKPVRAVFLSSDEDVRLLPVVTRSAKRA